MQFSESVVVCSCQVNAPELHLYLNKPIGRIYLGTP